MIAVTKNPDAIQRFLDGIRNVKALHQKFVDAGSEDNCSCDLCAVGHGTLEENSLITWVTGSGKGRWTTDGITLLFRGYRNSFKRGCAVFRPCIEDGWEVVKSTQPERGPFD